jgi:hypothetical protein
MLYFVFKMLASGKSGLPEAAWARSPLPTRGASATERDQAGDTRQGIVEADERAVGVTLTGGEEMQGDAVVIATDAPTAALAQVGAPTEGVAASSPRPKLCRWSGAAAQRRPDAFVNHAAQISNLFPPTHPRDSICSPRPYSARQR